jgi:hypothetical protein
MQSDVVTGLEIVGENAIRSFNEFLGPEDSFVAKSQAPNSLRSRFGTNLIKNAVHSALS